MAFISTATHSHPTYDFGALVARVREGIKQLPLGEERFTGSAHQSRVSQNGPNGTQTRAAYRPTYALQIV